MSTNEHNPPAFPKPASPSPSTDYDNTGMTLRDYFAGQVLLGCTSDPDFVKAVKKFTKGDGDAGRFIMADQAYKMADAMLAARKGGQGE